MHIFQGSVHATNDYRSILTRKDARDIFQLKESGLSLTVNRASVDLALRYGVSPKTIRDIWNGRSWLRVTFDLWSPEQRPKTKLPGRPRGRKDSKPRKRRDDIAQKSLKEPKLVLEGRVIRNGTVLSGSDEPAAYLTGHIENNVSQCFKTDQKAPECGPFQYPMSSPPAFSNIAQESQRSYIPARFASNPSIFMSSFLPTAIIGPQPALTGFFSQSMFLDPLAITFPHLPPPSFWPIPRLDILPSIDAVAPMQHVACPFSPLAPRAHPNGSILAPFDLSGRAGGGAAHAPPFGLPALRYGA